jgi:CRP-like cAMP-binding protein
MTEVSLYVIDVETVKHVASERPAVALALVTAAGDQLRSLVSLADDLSLKTATTRVARLLWERGAQAQGGRKEREDSATSGDSSRRRHRRDGRHSPRPRVEEPQTLTAMGAITVDRNTIYIKDLEALESFLHAAEPEA